MNSSLLKNKNYIKLLSASVITRFGDALDSVALSWLVYVLTGTKKHIAIIGDIGRGISVSCIAILFYLEYLQVWHLFVFIVINSLFESFANPARSAMFPSILPEDKFTSGSSYLTSASTFGGAIVGFVGEYVSVHVLFIMMGLAGFFVSIIFGVKNYSKVREVAV